MLTKTNQFTLIMKNFLLCFTIICCFASATAQTIPDTLFKPKLKNKQSTINKLIDEKDELDVKLLEAIKTLNATIVESEIKEHKKVKDSLETLSKKMNDSIVSQCKSFMEYRKLLKTYENVHDSILDKYKARNCKLFIPEKKVIDPKKYIVIGDNAPVEKDSLFSNTSTIKALTDVFSIDSKTNLGTFEIPGDNSFVKFHMQSKDTLVFYDTYGKNDYVSVERIKNDNKLGKEKIKKNAKVKKYHLIPEGALFKSIQIELKEGGIVDTRLVLESVDHKTRFYFEGKYPVSILHYTRKAAGRSILHYSHHVNTDNENVYYNTKALEKLVVKYIDVLNYYPNAGNNYVPDDVSYTFPSENDKENKVTNRRAYQVINKTHLQHVLDIRTYTDLLGLFGDESNGLFQIEGKADFFIHPFNFDRTALYYLKKVSPYVRYSRFDENDDFIQSTLDNTTNTYGFAPNKLDLLEKSNLEMGLDLNLLNFRLFKESPFWTSLYVPLSYNVTRIQTQAEAEKINFKTLGFGLGTLLELKRFNNFGLNLGYELKLYSYIGDYAEFMLDEPSALKTQAVKAEVFYYPGVDKSRSVFLRMKSIRDISTGSDSFFQLQVGYRFTLGVGAIKAN